MKHPIHREEKREETLSSVRALAIPHAASHHPPQWVSCTTSATERVGYRLTNGLTPAVAEAAEIHNLKPLEALALTCLEKLSELKFDYALGNSKVC